LIELSFSSAGGFRRQGNRERASAPASFLRAFLRPLNRTEACISMSYAARHRQKPKRESEKHRKQHGKISTRRADFEGPPPHGNVELAPRELLRCFFFCLFSPGRFRHALPRTARHPKIRGENSLAWLVEGRKEGGEKAGRRERKKEGEKREAEVSELGFRRRGETKNSTLSNFSPSPRTLEVSVSCFYHELVRVGCTLSVALESTERGSRGLEV